MDGEPWIASPEQQLRDERAARIYGNVVRSGLLAVYVVIGFMIHWR